MTEHAEQKALFKWAKLQSRAVPELALLYAIPNGGDRHPAVAAKMRAEGVRRGVPDVHLPVARGGFHSLYIEMKRPKGRGKRAGRVTRDQTGWLAALSEHGHRCVVCYGFDEAREAITEYLK